MLYRDPYAASEKRKLAKKKYDASEKGKLVKKKYAASEKGKLVNKKYDASDKGKLVKIISDMRYRNRKADARDIALLQQLNERKSRAPQD